MKRPRCLDLFCGAGGAAMGLWRAGFDIVGVDIKVQKRYPFPYVRADALRPPFRLEDFDLVWASPPCQGYSVMRHLPWNRHRQYQLLIGEVRSLLAASHVAYAIENVDGARRHMQAGFLCGTMFGLPIYRHRRIETSFHWWAPSHHAHRNRIRSGHALAGRAREVTWKRGGALPKSKGANFGTKKSAEEALGIDWMDSYGLTQAIPPAYSEHVGRYAMMALDLDPDEMARPDAG